MIEWISNWAEAIIIAVIIGTIIEMILPEGNSKKYIKVVIGIYVLFTIVSPIITKFTGEDIEVSDILDLEEYIEKTKESSKIENSVSNTNENSIMEIYKSRLKDDMTAKINSKGYSVSSIDIEISDDENYSILKVTLAVNKTEEEEDKNTSKKDENILEVNEIEKVEINIQNNEITNEIAETEENEITKSEKKELKEYISGVYEVSEDNITIN